MRHVEGRFEGTGGLELYYQQWLPDGSPRLVVVLVHGVGEHSGRYMNVVRPLAEAGYAVCSYEDEADLPRRGARATQRSRS